MTLARSIELNFASRPFRNNTLLWLGHALFVLVVVGFTAWNTTTYLDTGRKLQELRNDVGSIDSRMNDVERRERRAQVEIAKHDVKYLATQTLLANDVIQRRALSWTRLFNILERVQPYEVKMVSIRPVFGAKSQAQKPVLAALRPDEVVPVSVEGTAKDLNALLELERALIADPHFDRVEPERSTYEKTGELIFGLSFLYFPEGLADKKRDTGEHAAAAEAPAAVAAADAQATDAAQEPAPQAGETAPPEQAAADGTLPQHQVNDAWDAAAAPAADPAKAVGARGPEGRRRPGAARTRSAGTRAGGGR